MRLSGRIARIAARGAPGAGGGASPLRRLLALLLIAGYVAALAAVPAPFTLRSDDLRAAGNTPDPFRIVGSWTADAPVLLRKGGGRTTAAPAEGVPSLSDLAGDKALPSPFPGSTASLRREPQPPSGSPANPRAALCHAYNAQAPPASI